MKSAPTLMVAPVLTFCFIACAGEKFEVKYAADFSPASMSVSVFGVLHDGLMTEDADRVLGRPIFRSLHQDSCEIAFDGRLGRSNPDLFALLDKQARDDGITDDLVEKVASYAKGDFVLAFQMFGRPPGHSGKVRETKPVLLAHGGDMPSPSVYPNSSAHKHAGTFDVSAAFFSVRLHRTVAAVTMEYSGGSIADAMIKFSDKLAATFPAAACAGWNLPRAAVPTDEPGIPKTSGARVIL